MAREVSIETLVELSKLEAPFTAVEAGYTIPQMKAFEDGGFIERPKSEPVRKTGKRGRPSAQWRITDKSKGRVKRFHKAQAKKSATKDIPAEVETPVAA